VEVNAAVAQGSSAFLPGEILSVCEERKSAEAIVAFNKPGNPTVPRKRRDRKT
jgi:hypothetical protein